MSRVEEAISCFADCYSCSQAILSTYGTELGVER